MRTTRPGPASSARCALPLLAAGLCGLAACGAAGEPQAVRSTVTVTAALSTAGSTAPSDAHSAPPSTAATTQPSEAPSGDPAALPRQERSFDVAYVRGLAVTPDGVVLQIDRLTVVGLADEELARTGTPVLVDDGSRFTNQAERLYDVGVSPTARFFVTTCTPGGSGPTISSEPVDLDAFLAAEGLDATAVTFRYADGLVDRGETNPRC